MQDDLKAIEEQMAQLEERKNQIINDLANKDTTGD